jgi:hypothetical protein
MATIETDADVVRVIRENPRILFRALHEDPELLAEVRRLVLTEEVLAMPAQLAEVIERQDRTEGQLAEVIERQDRTEGQLAEVISVQNALLETQNRILADQDEMRQTQNKLLETQNKILADQDEMRQTQSKLLEGQDEMRGDIRALHGMYRRQHDDLGRFRGNYAADAARKYDFEMADIFARLRGFRRRMWITVLGRAERKEIIARHSEAIESLGLRQRSWYTFEQADIMAEINEWEGDDSDPGFYIAVEASFTGDREDVRRVVEHAMMLRRATGRDSYPIVAAVRIAPSAQSLVFNDPDRFIEARNEDAAFWYQLDERDLEPPDDPY